MQESNLVPERARQKTFRRAGPALRRNWAAGLAVLGAFALVSIYRFSSSVKWSQDLDIFRRKSIFIVRPRNRGGVVVEVGLV
jgi:hypothetical protein